MTLYDPLFTHVATRVDPERAHHLGFRAVRLGAPALRAALAGLGRGARLVGRWLGQLPEGSSLPWHRVLNSQGKLSLGANTPAGREQRARLSAEGVLVRNGRVNLQHYGWPDV